MITRHVVSALTGRQAPIELPFTMRTEEVMAGPEAHYNGYAHAFAGMGIQFMLMSSLEAGIAILLQRQRGLWKRLRAAPLSKNMLLGSRALSGALISLMVLMVLFMFGALVFGIRVQGSMAGFLGVCVASALMSSTFGLLVAALGKTPEATRSLSIFVILVVVMLGGAWVPSFLFPTWLQQVAAVSPAKWSVDGLDATIWRGLGIDAAILPIAALLGFSVTFGALAVWRFRWEE
jgi:ABC-2 type transport system permease protein